MAQNIAAYQIASPGFFGINTEDSPVDLSSNFASIAYNCIIDHYGRVGSRMGWSKLHTTNADINISNIECIGELIKNDGTAITLSAGNGHLFTHSGTTLSTLVYDGGGVAPSISANNWQFTQLNGHGLFFQVGHDPLLYDPANPTKFRRLSEHATYAGTVLQANCALSAFGRVWCANTTTDKNTIKWSDIITFQKWNSGSAGSLDMLGVWPKGGDEVVALASHNNFLIIFGKRQTVIYSGADTPSTMKLYDTIDSIGCIARDSVQNTGEDIIFLSAHGLMSLNRVIQEKSLPINNLSKNIRTDLQALLGSETLANIKAVYSPVDAFYLLNLPFSGFTYCFDTRRLLEEGAARITVWTDIEPTSFCYMTSSRKLYLGQAGFIGEHTGYLDDTSVYRMAYFSTWIDLGNKIQRSTLKKLKASIIGISSQSIIVKYGFDYLETFRNSVVLLSNNVIISTFNVSQFNIDKYSTGKNTAILDQNIGGNGKSCKIGIETDINGYQVSIQQIELFTKDGKL